MAPPEVRLPLRARWVLLPAVGGLLGARAFDIEAHDAIGQTTASAMDQPARNQVKRLLGGADASDIAGWGHQVDDTFPAMARLHFEVLDDSAQPFCGPFESRQTQCKDNVCLLSAIKHFYGRILEAEGKKIDYPKIDYRKINSGVKFSDGDAVKMLINLLGDLHQPMHVSYLKDDNGKKVQVKLDGKTMSLYDVWDKGISEIVRTKEVNFWLGGFSHVNQVMTEFQRDKQTWNEEGPFKTFDLWAEETKKLACEKAYVHPSNGKKLAGPEAAAGETQELSEADYQAWKEIWLKQILIAGERTAIVLNDILDAKDAAKLSKGAGVKTNADKEKEVQIKQWEKERDAARRAERAARGGAHLNLRVLGINFFIALVTVPAFLAIVNYGMNPATYAALMKSIMETPTSSSNGGMGTGKKN